MLRVFCLGKIVDILSGKFTFVYVLGHSVLGMEFQGKLDEKILRREIFV